MMGSVKLVLFVPVLLQMLALILKHITITIHFEAFDKQDSQKRTVKLGLVLHFQLVFENRRIFVFQLPDHTKVKNRKH